MKIAVVGAGAIGGYLGVRLAHSGEDVTFIARGANLAAIRAVGMKLILEDGSELRAEGARAFERMSDVGPQDVVLLTLKAHQVAAVARDLNQLCHETTSVVTMQNGIPWWYFHKHGGQYDGTPVVSADPDGSIARSIDAARVIGSVVYPAANLVSPGVVQVVEGNRFTLGELDGSTTPRIEAVSASFTKAGFKAPVSKDIRSEIWLKLWGNLSFNPVSALTHATLDRVTGDRATRAVCRSMMMEAQRIGERIGVKFRVDADRRLDGAGAVGPHKISMLLDLERGRPMEIDPIVTVVQEIGQRLAIATPTIDVVAALIKLRQAVALPRPTVG